MKRKYLVAAICVAAALASGACSASVSVGDKQVPADKVAAQMSSQLAATVGRAPDDVTCPEGLDAEVGATVVCALTDQGTEYDVTGTVTSVDGDNVKFDVQVADTPN
ncbi:UNVERIFIED_ORG: uncharacterized protein DUF4333 [Nocardia globerula]|uniref:Uncharacterized protein DUF4333 n=1 Tax=Nocardia globerula TaxID=1818 RepID=A0A652YUP5_NOCGL|nr:DUF4333 domain-containing protein [Rhodococcus globerulus]NMD60687.1 DUF4333 domain-containing protein [Nocardia globerula]PVX67767.1 uncharacterized protein DUF4333 [Rhodococcus globerulus]